MQTFLINIWSQSQTGFCNKKTRVSLRFEWLLFLLHFQPSPSVVGAALVVTRLIWHGLNNHLPASDWHSHKKRGERDRGADGDIPHDQTDQSACWDAGAAQAGSTAPSTGHKHTRAPIVAPWGPACSSVPLRQGWWRQNFPSALPQDAQKESRTNKLSNICNKHASSGEGCDVQVWDSQFSPWCKLRAEGEEDILWSWTITRHLFKTSDSDSWPFSDFKPPDLLIIKWKESATPDV